MLILNTDFPELVRQIQGKAMDDSARGTLLVIFRALQIELRFCKLAWCQWPFVPKKPDHDYCCKSHSNDDWNKNIRPSRAKPVPEA